MVPQDPAKKAEVEAVEGPPAAAADALFRDLFLEAAIGIYRSSAEGRPIFANNAFVRMMGYETEAAWLQAAVDIARDWYVDPARRAEFVAEIERTGKVTNFVSQIYRHATGEIIWVSETARIVRDSRGATRYYEGTIEEITARIRVEDELRAAKVAAERAARMKSEFLAKMSHELRTPLNGILGMAEILTRTALDQRQKQYTDILARSGETLLCVINDILDFSKIDAGKMAIARAPFDLRTTAEEIACLLAPGAFAKGLEFALYIPPEAETNVVGDEQRVRQVLLNLIGNAVKFTERGSVSVALDARRIEDRIAIVCDVTDTGLGIPAEALGRIFEKFEQVDQSITRVNGGTGLGLSISRELARLMAGDIEVSSTVGAGSTFRLRLRLEPGPTRAADWAALGRALGHVLVVDGCEVTRRMISDFVRFWGGRPLLAPEAPTALAQIEALPEGERAFDTVFIDGGRRNADGAAILGAIAAAPGVSIARAVLIARLHEATENNIVNAPGFDACLLKPIESADLAAILARTEARSAASAGHAAAPQQASFRRALLAEDNLVNRMVIRSMLAGTDFELVEVENGAEAIAALKTGAFDVVLMDISMPVMDGVTAAAAIRKDAGPSARVPIIGLSAHVLDDQKRQCLDAGMNDYLTKPVRRDDLLAAMTRWTAGRPAR